MAFTDIIYQKRTRNDDISAFEVLFKKHYEGLVNYSRSILKDSDAAEEIVQEFFYNFWKNRKEINIMISLKSYLYRSVRNNSLKYLDSLKVRKRYADRVLSSSKDHIVYDSDEMEFAELKEIIEDALSELPERCGRVFRMSKFDGMKYEEIAKELSVSVKTVEANMTRALKLLRERLEDYNRSGIVRQGTSK